jgi:hypothetical protein
MPHYFHFLPHAFIPLVEVPIVIGIGFTKRTIVVLITVTAKRLYKTDSTRDYICCNKATAKRASEQMFR